MVVGTKLQNGLESSLLVTVAGVYRRGGLQGLRVEDVVVGAVFSVSNMSSLINIASASSGGRLIS